MAPGAMSREMENMPTAFSVATMVRETMHSSHNAAISYANRLPAPVDNQS